MKTLCLLAECERPSNSRGLCHRHWRQAQVAGRLSDYPTRAVPVVTCEHPERKHAAKGLCKSCYTRQWMRDHPDAPGTGNNWLKEHPVEARRHIRRAVLKRLHGMTIEKYEEMWQEQGGKCGNPRCSYEAPMMVDDFRRDGLQVDHNHATDLRRGLLCRPCNAALGHSREDLERLLGLAEYIEMHS